MHHTLQRLGNSPSLVSVHSYSLGAALAVMLRFCVQFVGEFTILLLIIYYIVQHTLLYWIGWLVLVMKVVGSF